MKPTVLVASAKTPDGVLELRLYEHDGDYSIRSGNVELMNSRMHGSEDALAQIACEEIQNDPSPRVLIGGLGMGFTLRAALDNLPANAKIIVAELIPEVVKWNREILSDLAKNPLADKRVKIQEEDVVDLIRSGRNGYNAILLDVDNGPRKVFQSGNERLYNVKGLYNAYAALRPGGVLAIWSSGPDVFFTRRLRDVGFGVEEIKVRGRAGNKGGAHHLIWLARR